MKNVFVGLRAHFVDAHVLRLAEFLRKADCEFALVVDETKGEVETSGLPKVAITNAGLDRLGLYRGFEGPAWRCGDYGLALAREKFGGCGLYWLIEHDVRLGFDSAAEFFDLFRDESATDFFGAELRAADAGWFWRASMAARYPTVYRCLFPIVRLSSRALDHLAAGRRRMYAAAAANPEALWPNDEAFTATELMNNGFACRDFNSLGAPLYDRSSFSFERPMAQSDFESRKVGRLLCHPVLCGDQLFQKIYSMTRSNGDVEGAVRIVERLAGREWSAADAARYAAELRRGCRPLSGWRARMPRWLRPGTTTRLG
jgi:hypothetical protein